jgi:hypothetical protein
MKNTNPPPPFFGGFAVLAIALALLGAGCNGDGGESGDDDTRIPVKFVEIVPNGAPSTTTTTKLTLTFSEEIAGLSLGNITLTGVAKGAQLQGTGEGTYELTLTGVEAEETVTVGVRRSGYRVSPESMTVPVHRKTGAPVTNAGNIPSIKAKFGITETGGAKGVTLAFNELHSYIQKNPNNLSDVIKLGDWIDLESGLEVKAYGTGGDEFSISAEQAMTKMANNGTLCRLIVVGINSFNGYNDNSKPHVVFQFQNIPAVRRITVSSTNDGGYEKTEMRKYLVPVPGDSKSGNFLTGLKNAGVPEGVLWAPARTLSKGQSGKGTVTLSDLLWLPTEWEMFENNGIFGNFGPYSSTDETRENQTWLAYYTSHTTRVKIWHGSSVYPGYQYWMSSANKESPLSFCCVEPTGDSSIYHYASSTGVAPAFCVW